MESRLNALCELFIENKEIIEQEFPFASPNVVVLCSDMYTARGLKADVTRLKQCQEMIKENTGIFSTFRGAVRIALATKMAISEEPEKLLIEVKHAHELLAKNSLFSTEHLVVAAMAVCNLNSESDQETLIKQTNEIYKKMHEKHPFLTADEDKAFAVMLAATKRELVDMVEDMEDCFDRLKEIFPGTGNAVQSLSHILTFSAESPKVKCQRVKEIYDALLKKDKRYGMGFELATLGGLALLDLDTDTIVEQVVSADDFLKEKKGFGVFGIGSTQRLMHAALMVMNIYLPEASNLQLAALSNIISIVLSEEVAMYSALMSVSTNS